MTHTDKIKEAAALRARADELEREAKADPLLVEAAAVCATYFKAQDLPAWKEYLPDGKYYRDTSDPELTIALAALRRGMELASAPVDAVDAPFAWVDNLEWHKPAHRAVMASVKLGGWLSAALEDPKVCDAMKADIREWFSAGEPMEALGQALAHRGARWPGDGQTSAWAWEIAKKWKAESDGTDLTFYHSAALEMANRLRAHMTGEQP